MSLADRRAQALEVAAAAGAPVLLCADPANVHWLTGVVSEIETGPNPFAPGPVVLLAPDAPALLVISDDDVPDALPDGVEALAYEGFTVGALEGHERARRLVVEAIAGRPGAGDALLARGLAGGAGAYVDATDALRLARAVKDAEALAEIRRALAVADAGQARLRELLAEASGALGAGGARGASGAARSSAAAGALTELGLFAAIREAMDLAAGARTPVLADLVSGPRTAGMGGPPSARVVAPGEPVLCDLAPRVGGTWADSCATVALGEPPAELRRAHAKVLDALHRTMEAIRPGAVAGEVDALARAGLDYGHHTGHGIGSSFHEEPRLIPGATTQLQEGMVIALEPALYAPQELGIRLEHVVRVTADGCEDLSSHPLDLTAGPTDCSPMAGRHREVPAVPVSQARKDVA